MWSILQRELREQARQRSGPWLRVLGAGVVLAVMAFGWDPRLLAVQPDGRGIFSGLNHVLITAIWLVAPVLTADCLSREQREGTLGLLFLTPLTARDIVVGKAFVHALRSFTLVIAAVPVLLVPVLLGGLGWLDALRMLLYQLAALGLALAAGLVASSVTRSWLRARLLALLMVAGAAGLFFALHVLLSGTLAWCGLGPRRVEISLAKVLAFQLSDGLHRLGFYGRDARTFWQPLGRGGTSWMGLALVAVLLLCTLGLVGLAVRFATAGIRRTWQQEPSRPKVRQAVAWLTRVRVSPAWWRRKRSALLDRDPVVWRQTATWSARVTTAGWLMATMVLATHAILADGFADAGAGQWLGRRLLLVGVAFTAAASFREEKESGGLELLLVTPLSPRQLVRGRLRGMFRQFAPSVAVLLLVQAWLVLMLHHSWNGMNDEQTTWALGLEGAEFLGWMAATGALGLALACSRMAFLVAFGLTAVAHHAALLLSGWLGTLGQDQASKTARGFSPLEWTPGPSLVSAALAIVTLVVVLRWAERGLARRSFLSQR